MKKRKDEISGGWSDRRRKIAALDSKQNYVLVWCKDWSPDWAIGHRCRRHGYVVYWFTPLYPEFNSLTWGDHDERCKLIQIPKRITAKALLLANTIREFHGDDLTTL